MILLEDCAVCMLRSPPGRTYMNTGQHPFVVALIYINFFFFLLVFLLLLCVINLKYYYYLSSSFFFFLLHILFYNNFLFYYLFVDQSLDCLLHSRSTDSLEEGIE